MLMPRRVKHRKVMRGRMSGLAKGGYVSERREDGGRRRKLYELTAAGRRALDDWRSEPIVWMLSWTPSAILAARFATMTPPARRSTTAQL